jgi:predicted ribosomally synthesized six-cysteine peptide SCIFF
VKHIKTINSGGLTETISMGGCGECQTSCQSACKTSCTVGNQSCERTSSANMKKTSVLYHDD